MSDNNHPADELTEVRRQIKELEKRERCLRDQLIDLPAAERVGHSYMAIISDRFRRVLDIDMLKREIGDINRFYKNVPFKIVRTKKVTDDDEEQSDE